jgi:hypothetical protein
MIPGANHYGYTDLCPPDNSCRSAVQFDNDGTISRETQQQIAAAYLAAWVRYFAHGDESVRPYLTGERVMEGFEDSGLQVQADWPKVDPSKWTPTQEIERHS